MKRIDLHLHTMASPLEKYFEFDSNALMKHIQDNQLDAIAITNHNFFALQNYEDVKEIAGDSAVVFPGIEVSVENFHVLVIANPTLQMRSRNYVSKSLRLSRRTRPAWRLIHSRTCLVMDHTL